MDGHWAVIQEGDRTGAGLCALAKLDTWDIYHWGLFAEVCPVEYALWVFGADLKSENVV